MFLEKSKFCPKCGQELKYGKCENCGLKSKFIWTDKIFLASILTTLILSFTATFFVDRQIIKMQMQNAFKSAAENFGKSITGGNTETDEKNYVPTINDSKKYESNIQGSPTPTEKSYYEGESGINAFASQSEDILGDPQIIINIKNVSDKNISAVTFYCFFYDVYGEEIKSNLLLKNGIYTDETIKVGSSDKRTWVFYEKSIKTIKVYLKHVYFEDGSSYGTRDYMSGADIIEICPEIPVS